jgi:OmpA-OmpF porin, OOP family
MTKQLVAGLLAGLFVVGASAEGYLNVQAGRSSLKIDCDGASTCDKSGSATALFGGYKFEGGWALEAGYMNFGKARLADSGVSLDVKNTAFGGGAAFFLPMSDSWTLIGRLGAAQVSTKLTGDIGGQRGSVSDKNVTTYVGLGVGYQVTKSVSIDLATLVSKGKYNRDGLDLGSGNVRAINLGLTIGF